MRPGHKVLPTQSMAISITYMIILEISMGIIEVMLTSWKLLLGSTVGLGAWVTGAVLLLMLQ